MLSLWGPFRLKPHTWWLRGYNILLFRGISQQLTSKVQSRTAKVRQAARYAHIKIVSPRWLYDSISHWRHEPEEPYLIELHPEDRLPVGATVNGLDDASLLSSENEESDDDSDYESEFHGTDSQPDGAVDTSNVPWKDVDKEFTEYFGDDADFDESDTESASSLSIKSGTATPSTTTELEVGKRKRTTAGTATPSSTGDDSDGDSEMGDTATTSETGSRLAKRQKIARERAAAGSGLRDVSTSINDEETAAGAAEAEAQEAAEAEDDSDDSNSLADELERELMGLDNAAGDEGGGG